MSSLWTPEGEHRVPRDTRASAGQPPTSRAAPGRGPGPGGTPPGSGRAGGGTPPGSPTAAGGSGGPSEEEIRQLTAELAAAPVEAVVANHCYGLFELAALHLSLRPPQLGKASLAIDALALLVDGLGDRLGEHGADLAEGLNQLRFAYVRLSDAARGGDGVAAGSVPG